MYVTVIVELLSTTADVTYVLGYATLTTPLISTIALVFSCFTSRLQHDMRLQISETVGYKTLCMFLCQRRYSNLRRRWALLACTLYRCLLLYSTLISLTAILHAIISR